MDLREPFLSPCRGVMGSGRNAQNGRQGPGVERREAIYTLVVHHFELT
jgi:hypothetical protein